MGIPNVKLCFLQLGKTLAEIFFDVELNRKFL